MVWGIFVYNITLRLNWYKNHFLYLHKNLVLYINKYFKINKDNNLDSTITLIYFIISLIEFLFYLTLIPAFISLCYFGSHYYLIFPTTLLKDHEFDIFKNKNFDIGSFIKNYHPGLIFETKPPYVDKRLSTPDPRRYYNPRTKWYTRTLFRDPLRNKQEYRFYDTTIFRRKPSPHLWPWDKPFWWNYRKDFEKAAIQYIVNPTQISEYDDSGVLGWRLYLKEILNNATFLDHGYSGVHFVQDLENYSLLQRFFRTNPWHHWDPPGGPKGKMWNVAFLIQKSDFPIFYYDYKWWYDDDPRRVWHQVNHVLRGELGARDGFHYMRNRVNRSPPLLWTNPRWSAHYSWWRVRAFFPFYFKRRYKFENFELNSSRLHNFLSSSHYFKTLQDKDRNTFQSVSNSVYRQNDGWNNYIWQGYGTTKMNLIPRSRGLFKDRLLTSPEGYFRSFTDPNASKTDRYWDVGNITIPTHNDPDGRGPSLTSQHIRQKLERQIPFNFYIPKSVHLRTTLGKNKKSQLFYTVYNSKLDEFKFYPVNNSNDYCDSNLYSDDPVTGFKLDRTFKDHRYKKNKAKIMFLFDPKPLRDYNLSYHVNFYQSLRTYSWAMAYIQDWWNIRSEAAFKRTKIYQGHKRNRVLHQLPKWYKFRGIGLREAAFGVLDHPFFDERFEITTAPYRSYRPKWRRKYRKNWSNRYLKWFSLYQYPWYFIDPETLLNKKVIYTYEPIHPFTLPLDIALGLQEDASQVFLDNFVTYTYSARRPYYLDRGMFQYWNRYQWFRWKKFYYLYYKFFSSGYYSNENLTQDYLDNYWNLDKLFVTRREGLDLDEFRLRDEADYPHAHRTKKLMRVGISYLQGQESNHTGDWRYPRGFPIWDKYFFNIDNINMSRYHYLTAGWNNLSDFYPHIQMLGKPKNLYFLRTRDPYYIRRYNVLESDPDIYSKKRKVLKFNTPFYKTVFDPSINKLDRRTVAGLLGYKLDDFFKNRFDFFQRLYLAIPLYRRHLKFQAFSPFTGSGINLFNLPFHDYYLLVYQNYRPKFRKFNYSMWYYRENPNLFPDRSWFLRDAGLWTTTVRRRNPRSITYPTPTSRTYSGTYLQHEGNADGPISLPYFNLSLVWRPDYLRKEWDWWTWYGAMGQQIFDKWWWPWSFNNVLREIVSEDMLSARMSTTPHKTPWKPVKPIPSIPAKEKNYRYVNSNLDIDWKLPIRWTNKRLCRSPWGEKFWKYTYPDFEDERSTQTMLNKFTNFSPGLFWTTSPPLKLYKPGSVYSTFPPQDKYVSRGSFTDLISFRELELKEDYYNHKFKNNDFHYLPLDFKPAYYPLKTFTYSKVNASDRALYRIFNFSAPYYSIDKFSNIIPLRYLQTLNTFYFSSPKSLDFSNIFSYSLLGLRHPAYLPVDDATFRIYQRKARNVYNKNIGKDFSLSNKSLIINPLEKKFWNIFFYYLLNPIYLKNEDNFLSDIYTSYPDNFLDSYKFFYFSRTWSPNFFRYYNIRQENWWTKTKTDTSSIDMGSYPEFPNESDEWYKFFGNLYNIVWLYYGWYKNLSAHTFIKRIFYDKYYRIKNLENGSHSFKPGQLNENLFYMDFTEKLNRYSDLLKATYTFNDTVNKHFTHTYYRKVTKSHRIPYKHLYGKQVMPKVYNFCSDYHTLHNFMKFLNHYDIGLSANKQNSLLVFDSQTTLLLFKLRLLLNYYFNNSLFNFFSFYFIPIFNLLINQFYNLFDNLIDWFSVWLNLVLSYTPNIFFNLFKPFGFLIFLLLTFVYKYFFFLLVFYIIYHFYKKRYIRIHGRWNPLFVRFYNFLRSFIS